MSEESKDVRDSAEIKAHHEKIWARLTWLNLAVIFIAITLVMAAFAGVVDMIWGLLPMVLLIPAAIYVRIRYKNLRSENILEFDAHFLCTLGLGLTAALLLIAEAIRAKNPLWALAPAAVLFVHTIYQLLIAAAKQA